MHPAAKILIAIIAALLTWAAIEARAGQTPAQTVERLERLMALKQRADRAEAQQAKAEWATRSKGMKAKREWAAQGQKQKTWTNRVIWWGNTGDLRFATYHRYSPLGLLMDDIEKAVRNNNMEKANELLPKAKKLKNRKAN